MLSAYLTPPPAPCEVPLKYFISAYRSPGLFVNESWSTGKIVRQVCRVWPCGRRLPEEM
jgi:hypothetical protein